MEYNYAKRQYKGGKMALRTIRMLGDPVLNKVCREVKEITPKISTLIVANINRHNPF